jgi:hypothetical protein
MLKGSYEIAETGTLIQYYHVQIGAKLDQTWLDYLPVVEGQLPGLKQSDAHTSFVLRVVDQAELMGIINSLHGLGLCLLSVKRLGEEPYRV